MHISIDPLDGLPLLGDHGRKLLENSSELGYGRLNRLNGCRTRLDVIILLHRNVISANVQSGERAAHATHLLLHELHLHETICVPVSASAIWTRLCRFHVESEVVTSSSFALPVDRVPIVTIEIRRRPDSATAH